MGAKLAGGDFTFGVFTLLFTHMSYFNICLYHLSCLLIIYGLRTAALECDRRCDAKPGRVENVDLHPSIMHGYCFGGVDVTFLLVSWPCFAATEIALG